VVELVSLSPIWGCVGLAGVRMTGTAGSLRGDTDATGTRDRVDQEKPQYAATLPEDDREVRRLLQAGRSAAANALFDEIIGHDVAEPGLDRAAVLVNRSILAWRLDRVPLALELAAEGWTELAAGEHADADHAHTLSMLGYLLEGMGHRRAALDTLRRAVHQARQAGNAEVLATCLQRLGGTLNLRAADGPPTQARVVFGEARTVLAEGLKLVDAGALHSALLGAYGRSLAGLGELAEAEQAARQVLDQGRELDDRWATGVGAWVLATVVRARGELAEARDLAAAAVTDAEQINDTSLLLRFSQDLADICAELGDPAGEAAALRRSLAAARNAADTLREGLGQALEQRRLAAQAQRLATAAQEAAARDPLTGLANRLGLERSAPRLLTAGAARAGTPWLLLIDVDWFKSVNDAAGHAAGDAALREIAQLLRHECRSDDLVARWAGDEFVVLLDDVSDGGDAGPAVAERVRAAVAGHDWSPVLSGARPPTVSIGVSRGPAGFDQLFAAADSALYEAKRLGRNQVSTSRGVRPPAGEPVRPLPTPAAPRD
jgi:two-component system cell cycle response regulator